MSFHSFYKKSYGSHEIIAKNRLKYFNYLGILGNGRSQLLVHLIHVSVKLCIAPTFLNLISKQIN